MVRLTHAQASAVPIPAPITPNLGIRSALKITSNTHINIAIKLGRRISPDTFSIAADIYSIRWKGIIREKIRK